METRIVINPMNHELHTRALYDGTTVDIFQEQDLIVLNKEESRKLRDFLNQLDLGE